MDLLGGYDSEGESQENSEPQQQFNQAVHQEEMDSDDDESSEHSLTSAEIRAQQAAARLRDYGEVQQEGKNASILPSALDAFEEVTGPPSFLAPEATRPLAQAATHGVGLTEAAVESSSQPTAKQKQKPGADFDVSVLAPPLKGQKRPSDDPRQQPGVMIEGKAKRYKLEDEGVEAKQLYTPAQIAMMGGQIKEKQATQPMAVDDFLDKGLGGASLPRKNQDRKDKEKEKRMKGQSTHSHWKSEAEMLLRQQYD